MAHFLPQPAENSAESAKNSTECAGHAINGTESGPCAAAECYSTSGSQQELEEGEDPNPVRPVVPRLRQRARAPPYASVYGCSAAVYGGSAAVYGVADAIFGGRAPRGRGRAGLGAG
eukprot:958338-Rhodomonas_salina.1